MKKGRLCPEPPPQSPLTYPWAVFFLPWEDTSAPGYRETLPPARFGAPSPAVPRKILFRVESPGPSKASNTEEGLEGRGSSPSQPPPQRSPPQPAQEGSLAIVDKGQPGFPAAWPDNNLSSFVLSQGRVKADRE